MSALAKALHPWTCNWSHPDTDGGWLCNRAAADLEAQGLAGLDVERLARVLDKLDIPDESYSCPNAEDIVREYQS